MKTLPTIAQTVERRRYALPPGVEPAPDILDDDMPEPMFQHSFFFAIVEILTSFFWNTPGALVDGDCPVYYRDDDGAQRYVKPDSMVAFGVDSDYIYARNGYFIEEVGKPPEFVMETGSTTAAGNDIGFKRDLLESELRVERMTLQATRQILQAERQAREPESQADAERIRELLERLREEDCD